LLGVWERIRIVAITTLGR